MDHVPPNTAVHGSNNMRIFLKGEIITIVGFRHTHHRDFSTNLLMKQVCGQWCQGGRFPVGPVSPSSCQQTHSHPATVFKENLTVAMCQARNRVLTSCLLSRPHPICSDHHCSHWPTDPGEASAHSHHNVPKLQDLCYKARNNALLL